MIVVGIGRAFHDCSISAYINGQVKYAKYERYSSDKHLKAPEPWFWKTLIEWGIDLNNIDVLVETDGGGVSNPSNIKTIKLPYDGISVYTKHKKHKHRTQHYLIDHHLAHAWSNLSFNENSQSVIIDGIGSGGYTSMTYKDKIISRNNFYSPGTALCALGGKVGVGRAKHLDNAGKVMGLVPYGTPDMSIVNAFSKSITKSLESIVEKIYTGEGKFPTNENELPENWNRIVNNVATINELCYLFILQIFSTMNKTKPIVYSGGCALNVDWNRRLKNLGYKLVIQPHVYDGGLSLGCLRYGLNICDIELSTIDNFPYIQDDENPIDTPTKETIQKVAELLAQGKIVGWYQGNGELGPRALGNRSILMDPRIENGKQILNDKVKHREWFRPFGASVKKDKASIYFDLDDNPYMLFTSNVLDDRLKAITHVDGTCRHQTVTPGSNELFYSLLDEFDKITGIPVLLNTSLNLGGKPIAGYMHEAVELFESTEMDAVCIGNELLVK